MGGTLDGRSPTALGGLLPQHHELKATGGVTWADAARGCERWIACG